MRLKSTPNVGIYRYNWRLLEFSVLSVLSVCKSNSKQIQQCDSKKTRVDSGEFVTDLRFLLDPTGSLPSELQAPINVENWTSVYPRAYMFKPGWACKWICSTFCFYTVLFPFENKHTDDSIIYYFISNTSFTKVSIRKVIENANIFPICFRIILAYQANLYMSDWP